MELRTDFILATIVFEGDFSVGIMGYSYEMQLPNTAFGDQDEPYSAELREQTRGEIKHMYETYDGDMRCKVYFSDDLKVPDGWDR